MERFVHRSPSLGQPSFLVGQCSPFSFFCCVDCTGEQVDRKICESLSDTRQIRSYLVDLGHSHHGTVDLWVRGGLQAAATGAGGVVGGTVIGGAPPGEVVGGTVGLGLGCST